MQELRQNKNSMKDIVTNLGLAALVSFILVLPFAILEALNATITKQDAPGLFLLLQQFQIQ